MSDIGIIAMVPDKWRGLWMPRHHVLSRLARSFEVVWVEPALGWRDYWLRGGVFKHARTADADDPRGFTHYDPGPWLPEVYSPRFVGDWMRRQRLMRARKLLERKGCKQIVLYLWRYEFSWAVGAIPADLTCYHIDDEYQFSAEEKANDPAEVDLLRAVDFVIVHSPKLMEKKGHFNPDTTAIPNGVDFRAYSTPAEEPDDLKAIPRPRMGYIGVVKSQLDIDLLLDLSARRPGWSFVVVGPRGNMGSKADALDRLAERPNVYMLGNRRFRDLPAYTQHMDVCMMCYEVNGYTNYIYPLKLHEYLASGRPVVSSPIASVAAFADVVRLASTPAEWERALADSLAPASVSADAIDTRRAVAGRHDWDLLVARIADAFQTRLDAKGKATAIADSTASPALEHRRDAHAE